MYTVAVFLDLKRAFETVNHEILLKKLKKYAIKGKVLDWISNYLTGRKQVTKINDYVSTAIGVEHGVPQGSILGPLLFLIYINDINKCSECDYEHYFADDALATVSDKDLGKAIQKMNKALNNIATYLKTNKLKLNVDKTKAMILTTPFKYRELNLNQIEIKIDNQKIELVTEFKYLGFMLDNNLSLNIHFDYIQKKILKKLYFFSRVSQHLTMQSRITVYKTIIQPHFEYCPTLLYTSDLNKMRTLQKLQNRAMRIILRCDRSTPISSMLNTLEWLSIERRLTYLTMVYIYKMLHNLLPSYFDKFVIFNNQIHQYNTRIRNNLYVNNQTKTFNTKTLTFKGFIHYNSLPENVKSSPSLTLFKRNLLNHLIDH